MKNRPDLIRRAVVEARIIRHFSGRSGKKIPPHELLGLLLKPGRGMQLSLGADERKEFTCLIRKIYATRKMISSYRKKYGRRPRLFYLKVFGFPPRDSQKVKIFWGTFNIHFVFMKNDLIAFWRKVNWGPGSGGYYSVGDRDIKIQGLRGLVSFGREEKSLTETRDTLRHESVHAFEDFIKGRKFPHGKKRIMFYKIKSEMNAYLENFSQTGNKRKMKINEKAKAGLRLEVKNFTEEYLGYGHTLTRIRNLQRRVRRARSIREKSELRARLAGLKERLAKKRRKRDSYLRLYRKTTFQVKKALEDMPSEVLQRIIYETPFERLHKKIPRAVAVYKRMKRTKGKI